MNNTSNTVIDATTPKTKGKHGRTMGATSYVVVKVEDLSKLPVGTKIAVSRVQAKSLGIDGQPFTPNPQAFKALNQTAVVINVEAVPASQPNVIAPVIAEDNTPAL